MHCRRRPPIFSRICLPGYTIGYIASEEECPALFRFLGLMESKLKSMLRGQLVEMAMSKPPHACAGAQRRRRRGRGRTKAISWCEGISGHQLRFRREGSRRRADVNDLMEDSVMDSPLIPWRSVCDENPGFESFGAHLEDYP